MNYILIFICIISSIFYITLYTSVRLQHTENEKSIKQQLKDENQVIEIKRYPSFVSCNINPENDFHLEKFKKYFNIPKNKEIIINPNTWKYQIIYNEKED